MTSYVLQVAKAVLRKIPNPIIFGMWFYCGWGPLSPAYAQRLFTLRIHRFILQVRDSDKLLFSARNGYIKLRIDIWWGLSIIADWW